jgi:hypothetical protein
MLVVQPDIVVKVWPRLPKQSANPLIRSQQPAAYGLSHGIPFCQATSRFGTIPTVRRTLSPAQYET